MEKRTLGKTGEQLTIVGFGGIAVMNETPAGAAALVAKAVNERGINYFDVAPSYGNAQQMLGPALEPYRKDVFLACKTGERTAEGAKQELTKSLQDLHTDYLDLYQLHAMKTMEEVDQVLAPGGAMETFIEAREKGQVRFLGFSAHSEQAAIALMERFAFDTILFPFNWACPPATEIPYVSRISLTSLPPSTPSGSVIAVKAFEMQSSPARRPSPKARAAARVALASRS